MKEAKDVFTAGFSRQVRARHQAIVDFIYSHPGCSDSDITYEFLVGDTTKARQDNHRRLMSTLLTLQEHNRIYRVDWRYYVVEV